MATRFALVMTLSVLLQAASAIAENSGANPPPQTVKQIMNTIITPATAVIWGAAELQTDSQWQAVEEAALEVIAAGQLLKISGADQSGQNKSAKTDWQTYNKQMIAAARQVLTAVQARDEEALFTAGNDALYPPCESCHLQYLSR